MSKFPNNVYEITIDIAEKCVLSNAKCSMYELAKSINTRTNNNYYKAGLSPLAKEIGMYTVVRGAHKYASKFYSGTQKADFIKQVYWKRNGNPVII
ncbi:MAG: hypothetical protein NC250_08495 [Alistipes senegalensis]|nr:hypothetical protein [Bacteroides cellulosilyticus]MCM1352752.1 hypothetical protein [Alistipes senegalensis]